MSEMNFTDMPVWQRAHAVVLDVYKVTEQFPSKENFGLTSQLRRAMVSITSNIAEGYGRVAVKDKNHFYVIAIGSLREAQNQLVIARDLGYIKDADHVHSCITELNEICRLINRMIKKQNLRLSPATSNY